MKDDIIRDFVRLVARTYPDTCDDDLLQLELALRRKWGGCHLYLCKKTGAEPAGARQRNSPTTHASSKTGANNKAT